ncbi:MAG: hypothetical protein KA053_05530 [Lentimicrobiaceae bacterium]|nr:hypothetical protein [Lentimicrobiaceae bacterium]
MKKTMLISWVMLLAISMSSFAQARKNGVEVLYFKANLACCKARACSAIQTDVEGVLAKHFAKENIAFRVIPLADPANQELIEKYKAKSQTVVIVKTKGKKERVTDVSDIVQVYSTSRNKERFEAALKAKVDEAL